MWIDTTPFPPCKPNLKKKKNPLSRRASAGGTGGRALGRPRVGARGTRLSGASLPPGAEGLRTFLRREKKVLDAFFFFFQFSIPSINKPPNLAALGPARGGRSEGLGRGEGFAQFRMKTRTLSTRLAPFQGVSVARREVLGRGKPRPAGLLESSPGERPEPPRVPARRKSPKAAARVPGSRLQPSPSRDRVPS